MADHRSERALAAAERLFKRKPDASTEEFRKVCERADKATISKLTNREFNASYVLPFRRSKALRAKRSSKRRSSKRRPRAAKRKTTRRGRGLSPQQRIAKLLRERDTALLEAAGDSMKVYEIASSVEEFAGELVGIAER